MINNEQTKIQNQKDLKLYRFIIAMVFVVAIIIALIVGIVSIDNYKLDAHITNGFIDMLMPKQLDGTAEGGAEGMTFYREKNKDYDVEKDEPVNAFKYYTLSEDNKKNYLKDGVYYPPEYYMENSSAEPIYVSIGFYLRTLQNLQVVKKVLSAIMWLLVIAVVFAIIYIWYRLWCKREDKKKALQEEYNKKINKNNE